MCDAVNTTHLACQLRTNAGKDTDMCDGSVRIMERLYFITKMRSVLALIQNFIQVQYLGCRPDLMCLYFRRRNWIEDKPA